MIDRLYEHMDSEREALRRYSDLAEQSPDAHVRFLINLILEDERRHHRLFAEMAEHLRAEMEQRGSAELPDMRQSLDGDGLRAETKALLDLEREDLKELRELRHEIKKVADTRWWATLIDVMEADNRKHIGILEFVRENA